MNLTFARTSDASSIAWNKEKLMNKFAAYNEAGRLDMYESIGWYNVEVHRIDYLHKLIRIFCLQTLLETIGQLLQHVIYTELWLL